MSLGVLFGAPLGGLFASFGGPRLPFLFAAVLIFFDAIARFLLLPSAKTLAQHQSMDHSSPKTTEKSVEMEQVVDLSLTNDKLVSVSDSLQPDHLAVTKEFMIHDPEKVPQSLEVVVVLDHAPDDPDHHHHRHHHHAPHDFRHEEEEKKEETVETSKQQEEDYDDDDDEGQELKVVESVTTIQALIAIATDMPLWASFWAVFMGNFSISMVEVTATIYLTDTFGYSTLKVGLVYGFSPFVYMVAVQAMGHYSRTVSRCWKVCCAGLIIQGIGIACSNYFPHILWFFAFWALTGVGNGLIDGSANPAIGNIAETQHPGYSGRVFGIRNACSNFGFTLGPMVYWLFEHFGFSIRMVWLFFGVFCIVSAVPVVAAFLFSSKNFDPVPPVLSSVSESLEPSLEDTPIDVNLSPDAEISSSSSSS